MARSILAIVAGIAVIAALAFSADEIATHNVVQTRSAGFLRIAIACSAVFSGVGGAVAAWIARGTGLRDALILAGIQFVSTIIVAVQLFEPVLLWYYAVNLVCSTGAIVVGGYAASRRVFKKA